MKTFVLLLLMTVRGFAFEDTDTARFLAGLPVENTPLANFAKVPAWREHAAQLDTAFTQSEQRQLAKVRAWAPANLGAAAAAATPVFYFFSGPDVLYPLALFPNAGTYVLCAREPVGEVADPTKMPPEDLPAALAGLRKSLTSLLNFSFFITQDLRADIKQKHFTGLLPVIEMLLVRSGAQLIEITPAACDKNGAITLGADARGATPGVRIRFTRKEAREQTLYYFAGDLSNGGLSTHGGLLRFCEKLGRGRALLKAASYLPHESDFSKIRDWLLNHSASIVEDPSGIPFADFTKGDWKLNVWGNHAAPIDLFAKYTQPVLAEALTKSRPQLPFGFGYQNQPANAVLIFAERNAAENEPAPEGGLRPPTPTPPVKDPAKTP
jgi:hypothetical protein